jgi:murein DD-endopeptidase MepM/ murein hydrolase activator NlpD
MLRGFKEPGIAIAAPAGTEVCAVAAGRVITLVGGDKARRSAWGNVVAVFHPDGMVSWYGHLGDIEVAKGDSVEKGQPIATVGSSGAVQEPELAFRLFKAERLVDPEDYLP